MNQKGYVDQKIKGLSKIIPTIKVVKHQAEDLVNTVNDVSESSEKISGKIRTLDVARVSLILLVKRIFEVKLWLKLLFKYIVSESS